MAKALISLALWLCLSLSAIAASPKKPPSWADLNAEQQTILAPLAGEWNNMEPTRRQKWVGIAKRYPQMDAKAQARTQKRMHDWARLTPEQRRAARERYKNLSTLPPEKRQDLREKWDEYRQLPEEQRCQSGTAAKNTPSRRAAQPAPPPAPPAQPEEAKAAEPDQPGAVQAQ
ncbi:MAG: DUF3106 domain-containing protein [Betaproteobacteria bacterium]|nr:DUF3106 domain-containing protein [Betaproteobacteria bacterium]